MIVSQIYCVLKQELMIVLFLAHVVIDSELRWTVDLTWTAVIDWDTMPIISYSSYTLVASGGTFACDKFDAGYVSCSIPFDCW